MAYDLGAITGKLTLDSGGFVRAMLESQTVTAAFGQTFTGFVTNPVVAGIGAIRQLTMGFLAGGQHMIEAAEKLDRLSRQTGVTTQTIQTLGRVLEEQGQSAEGAGAAVLAFTRKLGDAKKDGGATADTLKQLGIDIASVGTGEGALLKIFDQLVAIEDEGKRAAAAAELFDRQFGSALATAVAGGSAEVARLRDEFIKAGVVMTKDGIETALRLDEQLDKIGRTATGLESKLVAGFLRGLSGSSGDAAGKVENLADLLEKRLVPTMEKLGDVAGNAVANIDRLFAALDKFRNAPGIKQVLDLDDYAAKARNQALGTFFTDIFGDGVPTTPSGIRRRNTYANPYFKR